MKLNNITPSSGADDMPISIFPVLFADKHGKWYAGSYLSDSVPAHVQGWYANTQKLGAEGTRVYDVVQWLYIDDITDECNGR